MNKRGQNVVEYILLVTAVILVFVGIFAVNGSFRGAVRNNLDAVVPAIDNASRSIQFSVSN